MNKHLIPSERTQRLTLWGLTALMVAFVAAGAGVAGYWVLRPTPFDPITFDTVRVLAVDDQGVVVVPQVRDFDAPSVYVDDAVPLSFSFCSSADKEFDAVGSSWFVDTTHGTRYELNTDLHSTIRPGCVSPRLRVEIPAQVRVDLEDFASGVGPSGQASSWYIEGQLRPSRAGGVNAAWRTETFLIIAARRPVAN